MIKFGASGNSEAFYAAGHVKSEDSALWIKNMGLDAFEYSFGRGVSLSDARAAEIGAAFKTCGVEISVHAPYYVNLANPDDEAAEKSFGYIIESAEKVKIMGGKRVVFHPASQGKTSRENAVNLARERFNKLCEKIYARGLSDLIFCPETMGKQGQIGTIEEITLFCKTDKIFIPTVDFGHVNARECGSLKTENDYFTRLKFMVNELGYGKMRNFHVHFSKIEYGAKGELKHLTFKDERFGPEFKPLIPALKTLNLEPIIICESAGTQDEDALSMKKEYFSAI